MTNSDCSGTGSSSSSSSDSSLQIEIRFGYGGVDVKSSNEVIDIVGSNVGYVEGYTNDTLSIKSVGDVCPSVLCTKDIVLDSDGS